VSTVQFHPLRTQSLQILAIQPEWHPQQNWVWTSIYSRAYYGAGVATVALDHCHHISGMLLKFTLNFVEVSLRWMARFWRLWWSGVDEIAPLTQQCQLLIIKSFWMMKLTVATGGKLFGLGRVHIPLIAQLHWHYGQWIHCAIKWSQAKDGVSRPSWPLNC